MSGRSRDSISARLTVDGVPYRESGAAFSLTSTSFASGVLERDFMLELQAGKHSVVVQWRKWGDTVRSWRSNPALLDGYASARFLAVMGERQSVLAAQNLLPVKLNERGWHTVGDSVLSFHLHAPAAVLLSYGLPVTQHEHPTFDKWSFERWSSIAARLVVDGHPYRSSASSTDGAVHKVSSQRGQLVLELPAGTHTACAAVGRLLRRKCRVVDNNSPAVWWVCREPELLVLVNAANNKPRLFVPGVEDVAEDTDTLINGISVEDIDDQIAEDYALSVTVQVEHGAVSLATRDGLSFSTGNGKRDEYMIFTAPLSAANVALATLTYRPHLDYYGDEIPTITVNDNMHLGVGEALEDTKAVNFTVLPVNDVPVLAVPAAQNVLEDADLSVFGLNVFDVDHLNTESGIAYSFEVSMFVLSGSVSMSTLNGLTFRRGDGEWDPAMRFTGTLEDVNNALQTVVYRPSKNFNSLQHAEFLSLVVVDLEDGVPVPGSTVRGTVAIQVSPQNDAPVIIAPPYQEIMLSGMSFVDSDNLPTDIIDVTISVDNPTSAVRLASLDAAGSGVDVTPADADQHFRQNMTISGTSHNVTSALQGLLYLRSPSFDGGDTISITVTDNMGARSRSERSWIDFSLRQNTHNMEDLPVLTNIEPGRGPRSGGTIVEITSSQRITEGMFCQFGPKLVTATASSNTSVLCTVPTSSSRGSLPVSVRLTNGADFWSNAQQFYYDDFITIRKVEPSQAPSGGGASVTVVGSDFVSSAGLACRFNATVVEAFWLSQEAITCVAPAVSMAGPTTLSLSYNGVDFSPTVIFEYVNRVERNQYTRPMVNATVALRSPSLVLIWDQALSLCVVLELLTLQVSSQTHRTRHANRPYSWRMPSGSLLRSSSVPMVEIHFQIQMSLSPTQICLLRTSNQLSARAPVALW